jgi:hypothetical protein
MTRKKLCLVFVISRRYINLRAYEGQLEYDKELCVSIMRDKVNI